MNMVPWKIILNVIPQKVCYTPPEKFLQTFFGDLAGIETDYYV